MILKFLITGYSILVCAILANTIANFTNISTWYNLYINIVDTDLVTTMKSLNIVDIIWLFIVYPIILGVGCLLGEHLYLSIISQ